jgi:hypothetical protein
MWLKTQVIRNMWMEREEHIAFLVQVGSINISVLPTRLLSGLTMWVTRLVSNKKKELLTLWEHLVSPPVLWCDSCCSSFEFPVLCVLCLFVLFVFGCLFWGFFLTFSSYYCIFLPFSLDYGIICPFSLDYGIIWPFSLDYGIIWPFSLDYGIIWPFSPDYGIIWPFSLKEKKVISYHSQEKKDI